jgi:hypothetical protein
LPGLCDDFETLDELFRQAAELEVSVVWTDALNLRPKVWQPVRDLVARRHPGLMGRYRGVLFNADARAGYIEGLRRNITAAAQKHGLADRLAGCP